MREAEDPRHQKPAIFLFREAREAMAVSIIQMKGRADLASTRGRGKITRICDENALLSDMDGNRRQSPKIAADR